MEKFFGNKGYHVPRKRIGKHKRLFNEGMEQMHAKQFYDAICTFNELYHENIYDAEAAYYTYKCYGQSKWMKEHYSEKDLKRIAESNLRDAAEGRCVPACREAGFLYKETDIEKSIHYFKIGAEERDAECMRELGLFYYFGDGVEENDAEAFLWLKPSAVEGDASAQYYVGECYFHGYSIEKNLDEAFQWYCKAAEQNEPNGLNMVGRCYFNGFGVEKNDVEAVKYYEKAVALGHNIAKYNLALKLFDGIGVEENIERAAKLYLEAANNGHIGAAIEYARLAKNGIVYSKNDALAIKWYEYALKQGPTENEKKRIYRDLVSIYLDVEGEEYDVYKAQSVCEKLKKLGGDTKKHEKIIEQIKSIGEDWLEAAKEAVKKGDFIVAEKNYSCAGTSGNVVGFYRAGKLWESGDMGCVDYKKAMWYYRRGEKGRGLACYEAIADLYYNGLGVEKNIDEAIVYYEKAGKNNREHSIIQLRNIYDTRRRSDDSYDEKFIFWTKVLADMGHKRRHAKAAYDLACYYRILSILDPYGELERKYALQAADDGLAEAVLYELEHYADRYSREKKIEWLRNVSDDMRANYELYQLLKDGTQEEQEEAFRNLEKASKDHNRGQHEWSLYLIFLGKVEDGICMLKDNKDYAPTCKVLEMFYRDGSFVEQDPDEEIKYMCLSGIGAESKIEDTRRALKFFETNTEYDETKGIRLILWKVLSKYETGRYAFEALQNVDKLLNSMEDIPKEFEEICDRALKYSYFKGKYNAALVQIMRRYTLLEQTYLERYLKLFADRGVAEACFQYGMDCWQNTFREEMNNTALQYLRTACEQGHVEAQYQTAIFIFTAKSEIDWDYVEQRMAEEGFSVHRNTFARAEDNREFARENWEKIKERYKDEDNIKWDLRDNLRYNRNTFGDPWRLVSDVERAKEKVRQAEEEYEKAFWKEIDDILEDSRRESQLYETLTDERYFWPEGIEWLTKASEVGHVKAKTLLGTCYVEGKYSVDKTRLNQIKGWKLLNDAARAGDEGAISYLKEHGKY